MDYKYNAFQS